MLGLQWLDLVGDVLRHLLRVVLWIVHRQQLRLLWFVPRFLPGLVPRRVWQPAPGVLQPQRVVLWLLPRAKLRLLRLLQWPFLPGRVPSDAGGFLPLVSDFPDGW